jgi:hypothetical protein
LLSACSFFLLVITASVVLSALAPSTQDLHNVNMLLGAMSSLFSLVIGLLAQYGLERAIKKCLKR